MAVEIAQERTEKDESGRGSDKRKAKWSDRRPDRKSDRKKSYVGGKNQKDSKRIRSIKRKSGKNTVYSVVLATFLPPRYIGIFPIIYIYFLKLFR